MTWIVAVITTAHVRQGWESVMNVYTGPRDSIVNYVGQVPMATLPLSKVGYFYDNISKVLIGGIVHTNVQKYG